MSFPNQKLTIHLEKHSKPVAGCEYCDQIKSDWPPADWTKEDLEQHAQAMDREMALRKQTP
jgi:thioredoxin-related protein